MQEPKRTLSDDEKRKAYKARILLLEQALRSVSDQCDNVIFNCEQRPSDNETHLRSWRSVRHYVNRVLD